MKVSVFRVNDFVWAKIMGYAYWPAIIVKPDPLAPPKPHENMYWVYFFGSHNYAWIREKFIKPYEKYKEEYTNKCSQSVLQANDELRWNKRQIAKDPKFKIDFVKFNVKGNKSRPTSAQSGRSTGTRLGKRKHRTESEKIDSILKKNPRPDHSNEPRNQDYLMLFSDSEKEIKITTKLIGILACNMFAEPIAKNLIGSGHKVLVWSPSELLCENLGDYAKRMGTYFKVCKSLRNMVKRAAIIFSCFSSCMEAKAILYELGVDDVTDHLLDNKIYIEMTTIDHVTSYTIEHYLKGKHSRYMEAMIQGTRAEAEEGSITVLVGAERDNARKILTDYKSCFRALGKVSYLVGSIGSATKIQTIVQMMKATLLAGFAESLALADKCIDTNVFLEIFEMSSLYCNYFERVCDTIRQNKYFDIQESVQTLQQDLTQFLEFSNKYRHSATVASTANQLYKHARRLGFDDWDSSSMFIRARY